MIQLNRVERWAVIGPGLKESRKVANYADYQKAKDQLKAEFRERFQALKTAFAVNDSEKFFEPEMNLFDTDFLNSPTRYLSMVETMVKIIAEMKENQVFTIHDFMKELFPLWPKAKKPSVSSILLKWAKEGKKNIVVVNAGKAKRATVFKKLPDWV